MVSEVRNLLALGVVLACFGCARTASSAAPATQSAVAPTPTAVAQTPSPAEASGAAATQSETTPAIAPAADGVPEGLPALALSPAQLALLHPVGATGGACTADDGCQPPLRCMANVCAWPSAMTGQADDRTSIATFATATGAVAYELETANTNSERARGLMFRRNMAPHAGMIFVFPSERPQSFWMRNTLIPLDMVFVRADLTVDSVVANAVPLTESPRSSDGPAMYVIELNAGEAAARGIVAGVAVTLDNAPAAR